MLLICAINRPVHSRIISRHELQSLPDHGPHSCVLFQHHPRSPQWGVACHLALIGPTQAVVADDSCFQLVGARETHFQMSCGGQRISAELTQIPPSENFEALRLIHLPIQLEVEPKLLAQTKEERDALIERGQCQLLSPLSVGGALNGSNSFDIEITASGEITRKGGRQLMLNAQGSQLECLNQDNQPVLVGVTLYPDQVQWFDENAQLHESRLLTPPSVRDQNDSERLQLYCEESGQCLENLSPQAVDLAEDAQNLLQHLHFEYGKLIETTQAPLSMEQDQATFQQHLFQLSRDYREILIACQQISISEIHREDANLDSGAGANILGFMQNLGLKTSQLFSSDTLYNQFKDVEILNKNLTEEEMRFTIQTVADRHPEKSQLQLAITSAGELTKQVVRRYIRNMELASTDEDEEIILSSVTQDFDKCLEQAVNADQIMTCADRVALRVPAELGKVELGQQLERNYLELFKVNGEINTQAFQNMKEIATAGYQKCLLDYYYKESLITDNVEKAKTCVFESMLIGYREGSRFQIRETFAPMISDANLLEAEVNNVREASQQCQSGALFHRAGQYQQHDYHALAQIEIEEFERRLKQCSQDLTRNAGDRAVRLTLRQDPSLQRNLNPRQRQEFEERVITQYFDGCMQFQTQNEERLPHPIHCENYIRQMVTLDVAKLIMTKTIDDQLQTLETIAPAESSAVQTELTSSVTQAIRECQTSMEQDHQAALEVGQPGPQSAELMDCLNQGIGLIAEKVAELKLIESLQKSPEVAPFAEQILALESIKRLPLDTRECFEVAIENIEDVSMIDTSLDGIVQNCTLKSTRSATLISAGIVLERSLSEVMPNAEERSRFIENYLNGPEGLRLKIEAAQTPEEVEQISAQISADVTLRFASQSIPQLVQNYLGGIVSNEKVEQIQNNIISSLQECLQTNEVNFCVNNTTRNGYQSISKELIESSVNKAVNGEQRLISELTSDSDARVSECLEVLEPNQEQKIFNNQVTSCIAHEVLEVSKRIPSALLLGLAPLMGSQLSSQRLQTRLQEADAIALRRGSFPPSYSADPATLHYTNLHQCLERTRSQHLENTHQEDLEYQNLNASLNCRSNLNLRSGPSSEYLVLRGIPCRSSSGATSVVLLKAPQAGWVQIEYEGSVGMVSTDFLTMPAPRVISPTETPQDYPLINLDQILVASTSCTNQFEENIRHEIKANFIRGPYVSKNRAHDRPLSTAADVLLMLQGSPDSDSSSSDDSSATLNLMREVGQQVVNSCRFDEQRCEVTLRQTKSDIEQFRERNLNATSKQLQRRFLASPFMDLAIEATIAETFKRELSVALRGFQDDQGILQNRMNHITSPAMIQRVFSGRYGQAAKEYIRQKLETGNIESLAQDQRLRAILASAVTEDLSHGSFVDELMYGVVQPTLNKEKDSLKVGFGSIFGVVRRSDFDWHRIRQTAEGQEARRLFAQELLEPMFQGVELGRMPSSRNQGKSVMDDNIARVEQLIEAGVKSLSR